MLPTLIAFLQTMIWLVSLDEMLFAGFSAVAVYGRSPVLVSKGASAHSLLTHLFPVLGFLKLLCCDAPECLMAQPPGRPAGAWRSPVESWVSATSSSVWKMLPAHITCLHKPGDISWAHQPLLVCLSTISWLHVHWFVGKWLDACVSYF